MNKYDIIDKICEISQKFQLRRRKKTMALIKLTPEQLDQQARTYSVKADDIDGILNELTNLQNEISENWDGAAWDKFDEQFHELSGKVKDFSQLLRDINVQLNEVSRVVRETDIEIANKLGFQ